MSPTLRRVLTFWPLVFYGLGVIVGAGVYVAIGSVIARAGDAAPLSFVLAGVVAALSGLCYAELASRFPEAAGAAAYTRQGFASDRAGQMVGAATTLAVAISTASIAHGSVEYLAFLVPLPPTLLVLVLVIGYAGPAMLGVRESVIAAASIGVLELAGLVAATVAGFVRAPDYDLASMFPGSMAEWQGVSSGAFIAFFAFTGFETLVNLAEEVKEPRRTVPRGIVVAIAISAVLYVAVAVATVLAHRSGTTALLDLFPGRQGPIFATVGFLAVSNGVLVQLVMLARLFYGMAQKGQLPPVLARVHPARRTPVPATAAAAGIVIAAALTLPFERLLVAADALTLGMFAAVDLALMRVHSRSPASPEAFQVPRWVPPIAAAAAIALVLAEIVR